MSLPPARLQGASPIPPAWRAERTMERRRDAGDPDPVQASGPWLDGGRESKSTVVAAKTAPQASGHAMRLGGDLHSCRLSCLAMESGLLPGADGGFCEKLLDFQLSFALLPICRFGFQDYFSGRFGPEFSLTHLRFRAWIAENCFTWNICFYITVQNRVGFHIYSDIFSLICNVVFDCHFGDFPACSAGCGTST